MLYAAKLDAAVCARTWGAVAAAVLLLLYLLQTRVPLLLGVPGSRIFLSKTRDFLL
jgi:hypothetical protein